MNKIRLLALDLDDTLLRSDLSISPASILACKKTEKNGITIVLASGRNIFSMDNYSQQLGLKRSGNYLICSNGAEILELPSCQRIYHRLLPKELCLEIASLLHGMGFAFQLYSGGKIFVSERNAWTELDSRLTGQAIEIISNEKVLYAKGQIKFVVSTEPSNMPELVKFLSEKLSTRVSLVISKPYFLEILPERVDKGIALKWLSGKMGIPQEEVMAIGDSHNDLKMVIWAGFGCAMSNALPEVKRAARFISERSNEDDGVAELIESVIFHAKSIVAKKPTP